MTPYGFDTLARRYLAKARYWAKKGEFEVAHGYLRLARSWVDKMPEVSP